MLTKQQRKAVKRLRRAWQKMDITQPLPPWYFVRLYREELNRALARSFLADYVVIDRSYQNRAG